MNGEDEMDNDPRQIGDTLALKKKDVLNFLKKHPPSDKEGLTQIFFHASVTLFSASLLNYCIRHTLPTIFVLSSLLFHSFIISFLFHGLHETMHLTAFKSQRLNWIFANFFGFLTLRPPVFYIAYHSAHHRHTGDEKKDPELANSFLDPKITTVSTYLFFLSGIMFWYNRTSTIIRHALDLPLSKGEYYITPKYKKMVVKEARKVITFYVVLFFLSWIFGRFNILCTYFLLPSFLGQPFLRYYLLAEHANCVESLDMTKNTRTTLTYPIYSALAWHMNYHSEHHAYPNVPFYALGDLYRFLDQVSTEKTSCSPDGKGGYRFIHTEFVKTLQ